MNEEGILVSLGYVASEASINQLRAILSKCDFEQSELEKVILLNDKLKHHGAYVAMSNSNDYFKIKKESNANEAIDTIREIVFAWSEKYKLNIEKIEGKETFYITGRY